MALHDCRDVPLSTQNRSSLERYEAAVDRLHGYFADPLAMVDEALALDPEFIMGHCLRAALMITATEKSVEPELRRSVEAAEALWPKANQRECGHIVAARAWLEGDFERSVRLYGDILIDHPRDLLALQVAHLGDFYLGQSSLLRDRVARVLPSWHEADPGFGYVLGMHAFGLEETALYRRAEETGRLALALNGRDPWAVHAVAHVMEMEGRPDEGIAWLEGRETDWAPENLFAFHNWWHLALYHLELENVDRVLALYDQRIRPKPSQAVLEMIDASALLWRLHLRGIDVGNRWRELADAWEPLLHDAFYAFNDVHAMMAFVGDHRPAAQQELLDVLEARCGGSGTNARMTREVGLPVCRALMAFGRHDFGTVNDVLQGVRPIAHRFGGSHAQRDLLPLTQVEAALRGRQGRLAAALLAERTDLKPHSPFNWRSMSRAMRALGDREAARHALERAQASRDHFAGATPTARRAAA